MISLPAVLSQLDANTYYSRSDADKLAAVDRAGQLLFQRMFAHDLTPVGSTWTPITLPSQPIPQLPDAVTSALVSFATADLLNQNSDDLAATYAAAAETQWAAAWGQLRAQKPLATTAATPVTILTNTLRARLPSPRALDEILAAINAAGQTVFQSILRENRSYFARTSTDLTLQPGTQSFLLPADCGQIALLAEQLPGLPPGSPWSVMTTDGLGDSAVKAGVPSFLSGLGLPLSAYPASFGISRYSYFGPFLSGDASATFPQQQSLNISPAIDQPRNLLLVYIQRWTPVTSPTSPLTIPSDCTDVVLNYALADLLRSEPDAASRSQAQTYELQADRRLRVALSVIRQRRVPASDRITLFGDE